MIPLSTLTTNALCRVGEVTNHVARLPMLIFYPTSRCNSRCVSCDWWKSSGADDLTFDEITTFAQELPAIGTRLVALSGGEPLLRADLFDIADLFRSYGLRLHLLTSGLQLHRFAAEVARTCDRVTISLDGSTPASYLAVRGVPGLGALEAGVARLKALAPALPVTARATLHAANFRELPRLIDTARMMRVDGISFLAADVSTHAFGRSGPPDGAHLLLTAREITEFNAVIARTIKDYADEFQSGFVAERPAKLRRLPRYYAAMRGHGAFPRVACNAPWVSAVVEANGAVRPCFFHAPVGSVRRKPLTAILRDELPAFRSRLDVATNPVCQRCVCSLKVRLRSAPW